MVVAHHPIVFRGLKRFNGTDYVERTVIKAIKEDVAIYAIHTNLDNVRHQGVNERIAQRLGLENLRLLGPKNEEKTIGSGMVGELRKGLAERDFLQHLKTGMEASVTINTMNFLTQTVRLLSAILGTMKANSLQPNYLRSC